MKPGLVTSVIPVLGKLKQDFHNCGELYNAYLASQGYRERPCLLDLPHSCKKGRKENSLLVTVSYELKNMNFSSKCIKVR